MNITLDTDMIQLITDLKWFDWSEQYTIAVTLDDEGAVLCACVVEHDEDIELLYRLSGIRADFWSIGDLFMDLLCSVAYGFPMSRPTGSHQYVLAMLEAIRLNE